MLRDISDSLQPLELAYSIYIQITEITLYGSVHTKAKIFTEKNKNIVQAVVVKKCPIQQLCDTLLWSGQ